MAYMNQEMKAVIKTNLDQVLKPLGIKFSLRVRNHMSICLTLRSGKIDFIGDYNRTSKAKHDRGEDAFYCADGCLQVNPYHFEKSFSTPVANVISKIITALKSADYYDRSDAMTDYFDTAYYMDLDIGEYRKPYQFLG